MNKFKYLILSLAILTTASVLTIGCGDDSVAPPNNGGGTGSTPNLNMKVGSIYVFTVDSLDTNGSVRGTRIKVSNTFVTQGTFFGQANAFMIKAETRDTVSSILLSTDTFYVRYDGGKFYQYGVINFLDSTAPKTWDVVADFTVAAGTQWNIANDIPITINGLSFTVSIKGKITGETNFTTHGYGDKNIHCFQSEIEAVVKLGGFPIGTVYADYYIGDANPSTNPSGQVRFKLRPIKLPIVAFPGADQKIQTYVIP